MKGKDVKKSIKCAELLCEGRTIREVAKIIGLSKSAVHYHLNVLKETKPDIYEEVRKVLDKNLEEAHLRGGEATRRLFQRKRELKLNEKNASK